MSTNVVMPQMGESIAEGTIVRWIKKVGDAIDKDEPLFEISTDKVDAEIPSPGAGVLEGDANQTVFGARDRAAPIPGTEHVQEMVIRQVFGVFERRQDFVADDFFFPLKLCFRELGKKTKFGKSLDSDGPRFRRQGAVLGSQ